VLGGALVAIMLVLFVVIRLDSGGSPPGSSVSAVSLRTLPAYWVVRPGETFALIARRTGLSIAEIEVLNPRTDPGHLIVGGRIILRAHP
jgi:LysM repeat protein